MYPLGFKELIGTIWSLKRADRFLRGFYSWGGGTCLTPKVGVLKLASGFGNDTLQKLAAASWCV